MKVGQIIAVAALIVAAAWAQSDTPHQGTLSGTILDSSGAVIGGANVTLQGAIQTKSTVTDGDGRFSFAEIPEGLYSVQVEKNLFKPANIKGIAVKESAATDIRVGLIAGKKGEVVEIVDEVVAIDTTSTSVQKSISGDLGNDIPLERGVQSLYTGP